ncbi:hypothetical protein [Streptomyces sp. NPDC017988]|uniref:hypothetical protein n=1 Tax=Streptomyces sp. NPDC017988 TaxID=3365025 RepID=UPI0037A9AC81
MSDHEPQPAADRQPVTPEGADALRAYAARTRSSANELAAFLEDVATNGLPSPEQHHPLGRGPRPPPRRTGCTAWTRRLMGKHSGRRARIAFTDSAIAQIDKLTETKIPLYWRRALRVVVPAEEQRARSGYGADAGAHDGLAGLVHLVLAPSLPAPPAGKDLGAV